MRQITKQDDDMLSTIRLSIKMSRKDKLAGYFQEQIASGVNPGDWWFYSGLNAWEMINFTSQSQKKHEYLVDALTGFQEACDANASHWPALLLRSLLRTMLSSDEVDEMCVYLLPFDYSEEDAYHDLEKMLEMQADQETQPWYFIPYVMLANRHLTSGNYDAAKELLIRGLKEVPAGRCRYLVSLLNIPVIMCYNTLLEQKRLKAAQRIKKRYNIMFPAQKIN